MRRQGFLLLGAWGLDNLGDQAILEGTVAALEGWPVTVLARKKVEIGAPVVLFANPWQVLRAMAGSRVLLLGGGTLLQDQTSRRSLWFYLLTATLARLLGCRVMVFAGGLGPLTHPASRWGARTFLNRIPRVIALRTPLDKEKAMALGVKRPLWVTSDAAFLAPFWQEQPPKAPVGGPYPWVFCPRFGSPIPREILQEPGKWTLLPLGKGDEAVRVPGARHLEKPGLVEAWRILQNAQGVLSQRLHGLILAQGRCPTPGMQDDKLLGFCPELPLELHRQKTMENIAMAIQLHKK